VCVCWCLCVVQGCFTQASKQFYVPYLATLLAEGKPFLVHHLKRPRHPSGQLGQATVLATGGAAGGHLSCVCCELSKCECVLGEGKKRPLHI